MAIQDFNTLTDFLGKDVHFTTALIAQNGAYFDDLVIEVTGKVTAVLIKHDLADSQFVVNDVFYSFGSCDFVVIQPNPMFQYEKNPIKLD